MSIFQRKSWWLFVLALLLVMPVLTDIPQRDVASWYAPMARAIAKGNWAEAFHPRIPFLFPLFGAASIKMFGCDAFTGVKIASALCFALTVFPLWKIFSKVFDEKTATLGCFLLLICSYWLRIASSGLRDSAKLLFLTWAVYGLIDLYRNRRSLKGYLIVGCGCGAMALVRDDSLLIAVVVGLACVWLEVLGVKRIPWRSFIAGGVTALILFPCLFLNARMTGYPVLSFRFIGLASCLMKLDAPSRFLPGTSPFPKGNLCTASIPIPTPIAGTNTESQSFQPVTWPILSDFLDSVGKGYYFWFAIPAVIMVILRMRRHLWSKPETLLLAVWLGHGVIIILEILLFDHCLYVSRRYLLPAAPLAFGWTALALQQLYQYADAHFPSKGVQATAILLCITIGGLFYLDALTPQLKERFHPKYAEEQNALLAWSSQILNQYCGPSHQTDPEFRSGSYATFRRPLVVGKALPQLGYLAGGEGCSLTPEEALAIGLHADFLTTQIQNTVPRYPGYRLLDIRRGLKHSYALYIRERQ